MKTTWITIALFDDLQTGKTLEQYLKNKRIDARTFNDKALQIFLFLCPPKATFRVQVPHPFHKMALEVLNTDPPPVLRQAIHCPACGSLRISYPQMTRKFILPSIVLNLGIIFRFIKHQAYCETCHHMWVLPKLHQAGEPQPVTHP